jgi:ATP-dependent DNA helicase RecG
MELKRTELPINLDNLIERRIVESDRLEFKSTWDEHIKWSVVKTICAFSNDLYNNNGGYIILGIEEEQGKPVLPPRGLDDLNVDKIQREIIGLCKGNISPEIIPHIYFEYFRGKTILVIWASAGDNRPYEARDAKGSIKKYWIRSAGATVEAVGDLRRQLFEQAAKIPFDDRRSLTGRVEDISQASVNRFLEDIRSQLSPIQFTQDEIYEKMGLVVPVNDHKVPRNFALLFFNDDPERFFRGARIEVVQFGDDVGGNLIEEKLFRGPLHEQVRSCLKYIEGIGGAFLQKIPGQAEVERTVPYPYEAVEEVIVNAVYHRSYEYPPEPVKVYLYPDRMEITSYPGPQPGIRMEHFQSGRIPAVPSRNRRIGDLLKDLRLAEGRGTGVPKIHRKMLENGSSDAKFDFDDDRTYFRVTLPVHPRYLVLYAVRESSQLWATGNRREAFALLERAIKSQPGSIIIVRQLIDMVTLLVDQGKQGEADEILERVSKIPQIDDPQILEELTQARKRLSKKTREKTPAKKK